MTSTLSLEEQAVAEWLENDCSIDTVAKKYQLPQLNQALQTYFKRFVNVAEAYHQDTTGELTHRSAAYAEGLDVWMYELFLSKFKIDREAGEDGRSKIATLKEHPLYLSGNQSS